MRYFIKTHSGRKRVSREQFDIRLTLAKERNNSYVVKRIGNEYDLDDVLLLQHIGLLDEKGKKFMKAIL